MTISNTIRKAGPFTGNGVTVAFPFTFKVFSASDVVVTSSNGTTETTLVLNSTYTVALNVDQNANPGGTVTVGAALAVGLTLTLTGNVAELQPMSLTNAGGFYPRVIEDATDRAVVLVQQASEKILRSLKLAVSDVTGAGAYRAGQNRIQDVADPVADQDVGNKRWVMTAIAAAVNSVLAVSAATISGLQTGLGAFVQSGVGAITRTFQDKLRESVSVFDFMTAAQIADVKVRTALFDLTTVIQNAINYSQANGNALYIPAGIYKITGSLIISNEIKIYGDGSNTSILKLFASNNTMFAIVCNIPNNTSIIGLDIGEIGIQCDGNATWGSGIYFGGTGVNSVFTQCESHDIFIRNCWKGFYVEAIYYMSTCRNITVTGVLSIGVHLVNTFNQILYCSFNDIEVTDVANGGYAFYCNAVSTYFHNLTADGCCYFNGAYTTIDGIAIEGIAATTPASTTALKAVQIAGMKNVTLINIPNAKCSLGIDIDSKNFYLQGVRVPDMGAGNQPNYMLGLHAGNQGNISNFLMDRAVVNKVDTYTSQSDLSTFLFASCKDIIDLSISYGEGSWTPGFATWTTAPSVSSAKYIKIGRLVTVFINFNGGVCPDFSTITGLPFASNPALGGTATMASIDMAKRFTALISTNSTTIGSIPAQALAGVFCELTAQYFAAS